MKYGILYEEEEPLLVNFPTSNLAENGHSILLHSNFFSHFFWISFSKQRRILHVNDNSETRLRLSDAQRRNSTLVNNKQPQDSQ